MSKTSEVVAENSSPYNPIGLQGEWEKTELEPEGDCREWVEGRRGGSPSEIMHLREGTLGLCRGHPLPVKRILGSR
jgi:hypothetical protein